MVIPYVYMHNQAKVLVIDEISVLDAEMFDKLAEVARRFRCSDKPFGGLQLILVGDFLQLPPVSTPTEPRKFCFESKAWAECVQHVIELRKPFRQADTDFVSMLNAARSFLSHSILHLQHLS